MANRRNLKKEINFVTGELLAECLFNKQYGPGTNAAKADELIGQIIGIQDEYLQRVNANGGKEPKQVKAYYKKLREDFDAAVDGVFEGLSELNK